MNYSKWLFWNVDTQYDFVSPRGELYVPGAELLKPNWFRLTELAHEKSIAVVNTADYHFPNSAELSDNPDFTNTFPPHCMANTKGAEFVAETKPEVPVVINWDTKTLGIAEILKTNRNIVIRKDAFDVFMGNPHTGSTLKYLAPKVVVVYGVTTNVCVNDAVVGLSSRVGKVYVIGDAIKELPNIPLPFENWRKLGVEMIQLDDFEKLLK